MFVLELSGVAKSYGRLKALDGISFGLEKGEYLYVFGKNGAGKTTLLEIIAGLRLKSSGRIGIFGAEQAPGEIHPSISCVFEDSYLYGGMTVEENLLFYARMMGIASPSVRVAQVMEEFGLSDKKDSLVKHLSLGFERRASIARAFLGNPELILLDEPVSGLDGDSRETVIRILESKKKGNVTLLFTSHDPDLAKRLSSSILILENGTKKFFGKSGEGHKRIEELS